MKSKMLENIVNVKNGTIKVETIVKERLSVLEKCKVCNSVVYCDKNEVISQARTLDAKIQQNKTTGRLCGAIISVKDNLDVKGMPATGGMKKYKNNISLEDCTAVQKLKSEDAIILGKTNMPAGAMDMQTFNDIYGRTNHPDFAEYTCGGSSGGGAAAVKLGISDADIGNDFMGSIRVPAHFCGVYGMIGTDGVISSENMVGGKPYGSAMSNILRIGVQASTIQEINLLFDILSDKNMMFPNKLNYDSIRIGYTQNSEDLPIDKEYKEVFNKYIEKLRGKFNVNELNKEQFSFLKARDSFLKLLYGNIAISIPSIIRIAMGNKMSISLKKYLLAEEDREQCIQQLNLLFNNYDILISPVTATSAFKHKMPVKMRGNQAIYDDMIINDEKVPYSVANMGYTTPFSLTSSPVIVIPIGKSKEGLPYGVQIVGNRYHDLDLIKMASLVE